MKVEFLVAQDDGTWTTVIEEVPPDIAFDGDRNKLMSWAERNLAGQAQYRRAVLFAVYNTDPEQGEEEEEEQAEDG